MKRFFDQQWGYIRGSSDEFSFENRMVNAICAITFVMVFLLLLTNVILGLFEEAFTCMAILMVDVYVFWLSRFRKKYKTAIFTYAIASYISLFFVYYYNSGVAGPTFFFFFLTFQVVVAVTPKQQHIWWAVAHLLMASALFLMEYYYPQLILDGYPDRGTRFADLMASFVMALFFMYLITIHLRNNLDRIRKKSIERAELIEEHLHEIEQQNEKLKEISWLQSHKVRSQVATILGLSQFIKQDAVQDPDLSRVISGIKDAANDLDEVIKEINRLTVSADMNKQKPE